MSSRGALERRSNPQRWKISAFPGTPTENNMEEKVERAGLVSEETSSLTGAFM